MIRKNKPFKEVNSSMNPQSSRDFSRIMRAANPLWEEILTIPENGVAAVATKYTLQSKLLYLYCVRYSSKERRINHATLCI